MAFCNTLINICQTEKDEWIKHVPFLYLQVPDDESIILGTTEHGMQLNLITGLEWESRRTQKKKKKRENNPNNRQEREEEEQQCH